MARATGGELRQIRRLCVFKGTIADRQLQNTGSQNGQRNFIRVKNGELWYNRNIIRKKGQPEGEGKERNMARTISIGG